MRFPCDSGDCVLIHKHLLSPFWFGHRSIYLEAFGSLRSWWYRLDHYFGVFSRGGVMPCWCTYLNVCSHIFLRFIQYKTTHFVLRSTIRDQNRSWLSKHCDAYLYCVSCTFGCCSVPDAEFLLSTECWIQKLQWPFVIKLFKFHAASTLLPSHIELLEFLVALRSVQLYRTYTSEQVPAFPENKQNDPAGIEEGEQLLPHNLLICRCGSIDLSL